MFSKELAANLIKIIDERNMTVESLANAVGLTREQITNIKNGKSVPKLTSLEKLCSALELNPNDLLLNEKSMQADKSRAMPVTLMYCKEEDKVATYTPVCPSCNALLYTDWESYCGYCGQRLSWEQYVNSAVTYDKPERKHI